MIRVGPWIREKNTTREALEYPELFLGQEMIQYIFRELDVSIMANGALMKHFHDEGTTNYLFKYTNKMLMSAGETPLIREA